ncbi:MAG: hypothetical protein QOE77_1840 [Blastocatellia bacterium]|jgi:hypothetical protein|nr:hypothetical protein [Blastocatellia bacterium]
MKATVSNKTRKLGFRDDRGAALITMLMISLLLLTAGGALIVTTSLSMTNSVDVAYETQAYYAAEAGLQSTLNVLRGNVAPNPLFDTSSATAAANKITFRKAVTASTSNLSGDTNTTRLSRWLSYDGTYTDRIPLSTNYAPMNGLAYKTTITDPDNSGMVSYSTSGVFSDGSTSKAFGNGQTKATLTYNPQAATTIDTSGYATLGRLTISSVGNNGYTFSGETFTLTITQTAPWASTIAIPCTLTGSVTSTTSTVTVNFPTLTNNLLGVLYTRTAAALATNGTTSMTVLVAAPEPNRLLINVTGYGPHSAKKMLQVVVSRFAFDFNPKAAITLRGEAFGTGTATIQIGNSAAYHYTGNDYSGGTNYPAFAVTNAVDYATATPLMPSGGSQVTGNPALQQQATSALDSYLQSADNARALVETLRTEAQNQSRYFTSSAPPSDFGATATNGLFTFVDGDVDLSPAGGAGLLVVTGTLTMRGSSEFKGIILVLGGGQLIRDGGGNGNTLGSIVVARFNSVGEFLQPTFNSNGSGTSDVSYDSNWNRRALQTTGPRVLGVSEF